MQRYFLKRQAAQGMALLQATGSTFRKIQKQKLLSPKSCGLV
jgi:hypothetical protein